MEQRRQRGDADAESEHADEQFGDDSLHVQDIRNEITEEHDERVEQ